MNFEGFFARNPYRVDLWQWLVLYCFKKMFVHFVVVSLLSLCFSRFLFRVGSIDEL